MKDAEKSRAIRVPRGARVSCHTARIVNSTGGSPIRTPPDGALNARRVNVLRHVRTMHASQVSVDLFTEPLRFGNQIVESDTLLPQLGDEVLRHGSKLAGFSFREA